MNIDSLSEHSRDLPARIPLDEQESPSGSERRVEEIRIPSERHAPEVEVDGLERLPFLVTVNRSRSVISLPDAVSSRTVRVENAPPA